MSYTILHGDCLELLPTIPDASVKLVLTDLPYGCTEAAWDIPLDLSALWAEFHRVCTPDAAVLMFADTKFMFTLQAANPAEFRYLWIWEKTSATDFLNVHTKPLNCAEFILVFFKESAIYHPQMGKGKPYKAYEDSKMSCGNIYGKTVSKHKANEGTRFPRQVLTQFPILKYPNSQADGDHPTQKPEALLRYFIRTYTDVGDTVLDVCMGTGSTGLAALKEERNFVGIEKEAAFFKLAESKFLNLSTLDEDVEGTLFHQQEIF